MSMQEMKQLLDAILDQVTFDLGTGERISSTQLRDIFERNRWTAEETRRARKAQPIIPKKSILQLKRHLRLLLKDNIDLKGDSIGLAFPAGPSFKRVTTERIGLWSIEWISTIEDFAKALVKGSAVLGTDRVAAILESWLQGEPVKYRTKALLNALHVDASLILSNGIRLEPLPQVSDSLPAHLPRREDMSPKEYLGRPILSIESAASPALFRPPTDRSRQNVRASAEQDADIATVCEALSLESNSFVDVAFYWNDYQELWAFSLSDYSLSLSPENKRVKGRPKPSGSRTNSGVVTLLPKGERLNLDSLESQLKRTLKALKSRESKKIRVAIERWIMSKDFEKSQVDSFIDLRIALESLYLKGIGSDKDRGEMSFRLSLYGAWHLGTGFEERKEVFGTLRDAYNMASKAVHGSDFKNTQETQALLSEAQDLCRRGILKFLREGPPPDKNDMILGVENDADSVE